MTTPVRVASSGQDVLVGPEVAAWLRCSLRTIERLVTAGELVAVQDGSRRRRYLRRDVEEYLARHRRPTPAEPA